MSNQMTTKITEIVISYINNFAEKDKNITINALHTLLNGNYEKYDLAIEKTIKYISQSDLQKNLYKINEKTEIRKQTGVYYTPEDVCKYIICNSIIMMVDPNNSRTYKEQNALEYLTNIDTETLNKILFKYKFMDPTCGSGEFLINLFKIKHTLLSKVKPDYTDSDIYKISKTIFGNDIQEDSTDISKIRLFFEISSQIKDSKYYSLLAKSLKQQFTNLDYVVYNGDFDNTFDCIIGNPPYVEYGKFENKDQLINGYGNIYADVIKNSLDSLKSNGVLGFIVPLSYISTSRMNMIRNYVFETTNRQFILNFADRPDCLFQGVHQKLNIILARKGKQEHYLFTSNYKHWYKEERKELLNGCEIKENKHISNMFIPKVGNDIEESIYRKVSTTTSNNILDMQNNENCTSLFLNMRGCFWIKSFSFNPGSKEYKEFKYDKELTPFINCLLNSSLFWLYWTIVSDCWHITTKELKGFFVPKVNKNILKKCNELFEKLEHQLEKTKKYIGSKQTEYEYKHKDCKKEIDSIDEYIAQIYNINNSELDYVKNFALKYRMGGSVND